MRSSVMKPLSAFFMIMTLSTAALAHHGWAWTTGGNIELKGVIQSVALGLPHGVVKVKVNADLWSVEVGQPWRNERAGLKGGKLAKGVEIRVVGQPSADMEDRLLKAEQIYINGVEYNLYPGRD